ncbi:hypothetical protein LSTR_LSTR013430 [Laodelphax striatellus]|uniref:PCI domain-containing protein n=1 Tax=Laodelphax striatellus TaxID=195883 RepID=A0A482WKH3_LAOST|nr:hypothetical protein LSTR_LSTR013430 [Laodelphax striatellus]
MESLKEETNINKKGDDDEDPDSLSESCMTFVQVFLLEHEDEQYSAGKRSGESDEEEEEEGTDKQGLHSILSDSSLNSTLETRIDSTVERVVSDSVTKQGSANYSCAHCDYQCTDDGELREIQDCFRFACPKFILPYAPDYDNKDDLDKNATDYQVQVFMDEVRQQKMLPTIRSYLKLYTTLPISKLAIFMSEGDISEEELKKNVEDLKIHLLCFKHKMKNVVWTKGGASGLEGSFQSGSELDFYIDNDMIHIADTKVANRYGDFFIRKILKFEELNKQLHAIKI